MGFHPLKTNRGKTRRRADLGKNSEENLDKDSPYHLLMFTCIGIVELVDMEESFIRLPTIARLTESCPTDLELHRATPLSIATMSVDSFHSELLLVRLSDGQWRCPGWVIVEGS